MKFKKTKAAEKLPKAATVTLSWLMAAGLLFVPWSKLFEGYTLDISDGILLGMLVTASIYDLLKGIIPNWLVLAGAAASMAMAFVENSDGSELFFPALGICLLLLFIRWLGIWWFQRPGMGMGDVKLFSAVALYLGWGTFWLVYLSVMLAGLFSISLLALGVIDRRSHIPFAPFITIAALIHFYWQPWTIIII